MVTLEVAGDGDTDLAAASIEEVPGALGVGAARQETAMARELFGSSRHAAPGDVPCGGAQ